MVGVAGVIGIAVITEEEVLVMTAEADDPTEDSSGPSSFRLGGTEIDVVFLAGSELDSFL